MQYKQIKVNIPIIDYFKIKQKAEEADLKLSGYLKNMLVHYNLLNIKKTRNFKKVDKNLLYELNKIGNNLNQIAKKINIKKFIDKEALIQLEKIEKELINIRKNYED